MCENGLQMILVCLSLLGCWTPKKKPCVLEEVFDCGSIWIRTLQITRSPFPGEDGHFNSCLDSDDSGVSLDSAWRGLSIPTVACCRHIIQRLWSFSDCSRTRSRSRWERNLKLCYHLINNYCFRFGERRTDIRWLSEDSKLLPELVGQQIVSQKP